MALSDTKKCQLEGFWTQSDSVLDSNSGKMLIILKVSKMNAQSDRKHKVEVTCKTDPVCEHIFLHRLRKTCATRWQEHGVPIRTIQAWLGHKNLETTMLYLGVTDTEKLGVQVDTAFGD